MGAPKGVKGKGKVPKMPGAEKAQKLRVKFYKELKAKNKKKGAKLDKEDPSGWPAAFKALHKADWTPKQRAAMEKFAKQKAGKIGDFGKSHTWFNPTMGRRYVKRGYTT